MEQLETIPKEMSAEFADFVYEFRAQDWDSKERAFAEKASRELKRNNRGGLLNGTDRTLRST